MMVQEEPAPVEMIQTTVDVSLVNPKAVAVNMQHRQSLKMLIQVMLLTVCIKYLTSKRNSISITIEWF